MELQYKSVPPAPISGQKVKFVSIFHPSDRVTGHQFLQLPALDTFVPSATAEQVEDVYDYQTALDICEILAGNKSGYFTLFDDETDQQIPNSQWLLPRRYIYHLHSGNSDYAIIPNFRCWKFSEQLPHSWSALKEDLSTNTVCSKSDVSAVVRTRDRRCRVCGTRYGLTSAHLVPAAEKSWFRINDMNQFCYKTDFSDNAINDMANQVGMRMDLRILVFDRGIYTIAVKAGRAVVHFLQADPVTRSELVPLFHNSLFNTDGIAIAFLYARFAWSIFTGGLYLNGLQKFLIMKDDGVTQSTEDYLRKLKPEPKSKKTQAASEGTENTLDSAEDDDEMEEQDSQGDGGDGQSEDGQDENEERGESVKQPAIMTDEALLKKRFPFFYTENGMAGPHDYEMLSVYPEMDKIRELKAKWIQEHPQIHLLANPGEPST